MDKKRIATRLTAIGATALVAAGSVVATAPAAQALPTYTTTYVSAIRYADAKAGCLRLGGVVTAYNRHTVPNVSYTVTCRIYRPAYLR